jgi:hypothetical protein
MVLTYNFAPASNYFSNNQPSPIPTNDLLLYVNSKDPTSYPGSLNTFFDLSSNNNNMTISNCTWDNVNKVFNFNGINSIITTPNLLTQLRESNAVISQSYEVWFKTSTDGVIVNETNNAGWHDTQIENVSNQLKSRYYNTIPPVELGSNDSSRWMYAALSYNGSTNQIFGNLNGTQTAITTGFTRALNPNPGIISFNLGQGDSTNMGSGAFFNGQMAIYRIYKRALTNTEIVNNYNAQKGLFGL